MNDKNELNDIILNKGGSSSSNKKIVLAVATLGVILIIVIMLMNSLSSNGTDNLPQAVLPPQPQVEIPAQPTEEPLFEEIEVAHETNTDADLDLITQKLKQESLKEQATEPEVEKVQPQEKPVVEKQKTVKVKTKVADVKPTGKIEYYIQVGSFSKYEPNKKFLDSITSLGFNYKYHKVISNSQTFNKVLVGPFTTQSQAEDARRILRSKVEPGAFLLKL